MIFRLLIFSILSAITTNIGLSQIDIEILQFKTIDKTSFIDVIIDIPGELCNYQKAEQDWLSTTKITVIAESKGDVKAFKKTSLLSPLFKDSSEAINTNQIHLERLALPPSEYQISINIEAKTEHSFTRGVKVHHSGAPEVSDILLVEAFAKSEESKGSKFFRSGFEMIPVVGKEIPLEATQFKFYTELYNINEVVGEDSLFLLVFGFTDSNGILDPNFTRYKRLNAKGVTPVFEVLPVSPATPPSTNGSIVVQARTRDGNLIAEKYVPISRNIISGYNNEVSFAREITDRFELYRHLEDHLPLASPSQQHTIGRTLKEVHDITVLQGFLEQFWIKRNPLDPEKAWREYCGEIALVDTTFGGCRSGHGADTDMGYVYLKYGKPNTVVKRHHDTDYYPYEIWHYHHTNGFTNRRFLFFAPHVVTECMEILQSDMPGEIQNEDWIQMLRSRENRTQVINSQLNRMNPRDTYSREEPEDLYYNPR